MSPIFVLALVLLVVSDLAAGLTLWQMLLWDANDHIGEVRTEAVAAVSSLPLPQPSLQLDSYNEIVSRPVFWRSRSPWRPPTAAIAPAPQGMAIRPDLPQGFTLMAVVISPGSARALLSSSHQMDGSWVKQGEMFSGWLVAEIKSGSATLRQSDTELKLFLFPNGHTASK